MKKLLTVLCFMSTTAFSEEIFRLEAQIGNHSFNDILIVDSCINNVLKGSLTVPGIFSSPIEQGTCEPFMNFKIKARENGGEYYVAYVLKGKKDEMIGDMSVDGEVMGTIKGKLIFKDK